jgi:hypothetical protein
MNDHTNDSIRAEVLAQLQQELQLAAPSVDWRAMLRPGVSSDPEPPEPDLFDQVLTVRHTLEAAGALLLADDRPTLTVAALAQFIGGLSDDEIVGLSVAGAAEDVADLALPNLPAPTRLALARGLQRTAEQLLDLSLDLTLAGGLTFTVNPIDEIEFGWRDES